MSDFFSIIRQYARQQANTYADLIGSTTKEEQLIRNLTEEERKEYFLIKESNKQRIYTVSGNNKKNDTRIEQPKTTYISGIGNTTQIM